MSIRHQKYVKELLKQNPQMLEFASNYFKTNSMRQELVRFDLYFLKVVPDHLKNKIVWNEALRISLAAFVLSLTDSKHEYQRS